MNQEILEKYLVNSTEMILETTDEFLNKFSVQNLRNEELVKIFNEVLKHSEQIGEESSLGSVYNFDTDKVLKVVFVCPESQFINNLAYQMCFLAQEGDLIFRVPNTQTGKKVVIMPGYISEAIISVLLTKYLKYTPSFTKTLSVQYDPEGYQKPLYILQEKLYDMTPVIKSRLNFLQAIFQITHALYIGQELGRYVHYDLHVKNMMIRPVKTVRGYEIGDGRYIYMNSQFDTVLIDYGLNRMETKEDIISPQTIISYGGREWTEYNEFNPYVDIFTLIFDMERKAKGLVNNYTQFPWKTPEEVEETFRELWLAFINPSPTIESVDEQKEFINDWLYYVLGGSTWRPMPEKLAITWKHPKSGRITRISRAREMLSKITYMMELDLPIEKDGEIIEINTDGDIVDYLTNYDYYFSNYILGLKDVQVYSLPSSKICMKTNYYNYTLKNNDKISDVVNIFTFEPGFLNNFKDRIQLEYQPYNLKKGGDLNDQYIHLAIIDPVKGKEQGYKFNFDCCKIDIRNYLQDTKIKSGIAMNTSFFDIKNTYLPVGPFRSKGFVSDGDIPYEYKEYYGILGINEEGDLEINTLKNEGQYKDVVSAGPLLLQNGEFKVTPELLSNPIFQCDINNPDMNISDCMSIQPGELSHSANVNPRSAIGITIDGRVLFVRVEGRNARGTGMDLLQLAQLMKIFECVNAINLDGGGSSKLIWRAPGSKTISISDPASVSSYPIGTLISYIK